MDTVETHVPTHGPGATESDPAQLEADLMTCRTYATGFFDNAQRKATAQAFMAGLGGALAISFGGNLLETAGGSLAGGAVGSAVAPGLINPAVPPENEKMQAIARQFAIDGYFSVDGYVGPQIQAKRFIDRCMTVHGHSIAITPIPPGKPVHTVPTSPTGKPPLG